MSGPEDYVECHIVQEIPQLSVDRRLRRSLGKRLGSTLKRHDCSGGRDERGFILVEYHLAPAEILAVQSVKCPYSCPMSQIIPMSNYNPELLLEGVYKTGGDLLWQIDVK